nr:MAG TPA_asm: hypothetical protein [Bacteriophage sp.]
MFPSQHKTALKRERFVYQNFYLKEGINAKLCQVVIIFQIFQFTLYHPDSGQIYQ